MKNVGVIGAYGRLGKAICEAVETSEHELVVKVGRDDDITTTINASSVDVVVDVTTAESARVNLPWLAARGLSAVVGTTGFGADDIAEFDAAFKKAGKSCFLVPNFSLGAVLMMRFAAEAATYFEDVEIIELHHEKKVDAPSGTASLTAAMINASRQIPLPEEPGHHSDEKRARGADLHGVRVHSVRLPGLQAHQEVILGSAGQVLTIRHDSFDRSAYMPGVLLAVSRIDSLPPGVTTGLEAVMD